MKKYNEGDIIISNGQTYVCEVASDKKAAFVAKDFGFLDGKPHTMGCGGDSVPCSKTLILKPSVFPTEFGVKMDQKGAIMKGTQDYLIVGKLIGECCQTPYWNTRVLRDHYPDLYFEVLERERTAILDKIAIKAPVVSVKKTPRKAPAKKVTRKTSRR